MPFQHLHGVTDPLAADSVIDWFATFQAWITGTVGWAVSSGGGTTTLVIRSGGEAGGMTKLFVRIERDGGAPNHVILDVQDDGNPIPVHRTTSGGFLDSGGVQFEYWMSADKDAIAIVWKMGGLYTPSYAGLLMPFALNPADETEYMAVMGNNLDGGTVLHFHTGAWDHNDANNWNDYIEDAPIDADTGDLVIGGIYHDQQNEIAGQYKFLTGEITVAALAPEDTISTTQALATTDWTVFRDSDVPARKFAMRTGGILPLGKDDDPGFAHVSAIGGTLNAFHDAINAHLVAIGWTPRDLSGLTANVRDWQYHSTGTSGLEDIWIRIYINFATASTMVRIQDGDYPAVNSEFRENPIWSNAMFPTNYYISADLDCVLMTVNNGGDYRPCWMGAINSFASGLSSPFMRVASLCRRAGCMLLDHDGVTFDENFRIDLNGDGVQSANCNPNLYDGTTYLVWPRAIQQEAVPNHCYGTLKYFFVTTGGIAILDTITVAARVYTYFFDTSQNYGWLMRTV